MKHKSGINKEQLLGSQDINVQFMDFVTDVRVFAHNPYNFKVGWLKNVPGSFLNSESPAIYIQLQDYLQVTTYQFINSGN